MKRPIVVFPIAKSAIRGLMPTVPVFSRVLAALAIATGLAMAEDAYVEGEVLVTFKPTVDARGAEGALARRSLAVAQRFERLSRHRGRVSTLVREKSRGTARLIAELKADPTVETVEPNYLRHVSAAASGEPDFGKLWGLRNTGQTVNGVTGIAGADTRFVDAWKLARTDGPEVVVAIADTGLDTTHPDLAGNLWTNPGEIAGNGLDDDSNGRIDDIHGFDFTGNTGIMSDSGDHGTHVAGTIGASGRNGLGITGLQFKAKLLPLKVSSDGDAISTSAILAAFDYAVDLKERGVNLVAINASFGGSSSSTTERVAIEALRDAGIVLCAAAGNESANNDSTASYPANYAVSNIISVAALTPANQLANYSNYGATTVDLAAPGSEIYSTMPLEFASQASLKIGSAVYAAAAIAYSGTTGASGITGSLHACGIGQTGQFPAGVAGNIALIQRGTLTFAEKVTNAIAAGAVAVVIYDNSSSSITTNPWTLGGSGNWIPAIRISQANGQSIVASSLPVTATFTRIINPAAAYQFLDGTSMAAPHVTGAVAFAAMNFPAETVAQRISRILTRTTAVPALTGKVATGGRLDLLKMIDTDNDSLPDWWESEEIGNLASAAASDPDGDAVTNADEFLSGSAPLDGSSKLAFASFGANTTGVSGSFPTIAGRLYQIEWSDNLSSGSWSQLGNAITGDGNPHVFTDAAATPASPRRFYRLSVISAAP
ncbi:S8 family serine peptidase [Luteolibacter arcticus]|uniref:S8 family serine peptidase n=1 Tax=Luteolibacter arcticus TaxID=1581411 RepID=A0ABT3GIH8_9BACT|nr:S8 family serine peptidase [Luteolibacter arcticus]MCW1923291.1 S8 family serine peptidase [Luteolibacter arcticus]